MKSYLKVLTFVAIVGIMTSSCEKEQLITKYQPQPELSEQSVVWANGRIYTSDGLGNVKVTGYYMRDLYDNWLTSGCHLPQANCLPDVDVNGSSNSDYPSGGSFTTNPTLELEVSEEYSNDLIDAVGSGHASVKSWYSNTGHELLDFPSQAVSDLENDLVTIKSFTLSDGGVIYALVKMDATLPDDVDSYDWGN